VGVLLDECLELKEKSMILRVGVLLLVSLI
jgi:hypothetical protein